MELFVDNDIPLYRTVKHDTAIFHNLAILAWSEVMQSPSALVSATVYVLSVEC